METSFAVVVHFNRSKGRRHRLAYGPYDRAGGDDFGRWLKSRLPADAVVDVTGLPAGLSAREAMSRLTCCTWRRRHRRPVPTGSGGQS
jgi:hypothetical protein